MPAHTKSTASSPTRRILPSAVSPMWPKIWDFPGSAARREFFLPTRAACGRAWPNSAYPSSQTGLSPPSRMHVPSTRNSAVLPAKAQHLSGSSSNLWIPREAAVFRSVPVKRNSGTNILRRPAGQVIKKSLSSTSQPAGNLSWSLSFSIMNIIPCVSAIPVTSISPMPLPQKAGFSRQQQTLLFAAKYLLWTKRSLRASVSHRESPTANTSWRAMKYT